MRSTLLIALLSLSACAADTDTGEPTTSTPAALSGLGGACVTSADCLAVLYCTTGHVCATRGGATDFDFCPPSYVGTSAPCAGTRVCGQCCPSWPCQSAFACLTTSDFDASVSGPHSVCP